MPQPLINTSIYSRRLVLKPAVPAAYAVFKVISQMEDLLFGKPPVAHKD